MDWRLRSQFLQSLNVRLEIKFTFDKVRILDYGKRTSVLEYKETKLPNRSTRIDDANRRGAFVSKRRQENLYTINIPHTTILSSTINFHNANISSQVNSDIAAIANFLDSMTAILEHNPDLLSCWGSSRHA